MKTVHFRRMLAGALAPIGCLLIATPAAADLVLDFDNARPDASTLPVYITFTGAPAGGFDATIAGTNTQLQEGVSYSLSTLAAGVDVTQYTSGLVFVSLGSPLVGLTPGANYAPDFASPTSPNFLTRMDKYEITYGVPASGGAPTGGANLSSTDFFGIPLQLQTTGGGRLLRQQSLRPRSRGVVPRLLPVGGVGLRRRHGRGFRRGRLAHRRPRALGHGRVGRAVRRPRRGRSPRRELHRDARTGLPRRRLGERGLRDLDAGAAQRSDDVRDLAHDAERHDRLAACLRRADAERDNGFRERALDPDVDRRRPDRARRARARIGRRPAPHLEHQAQRLLFWTPVVERQRQRHQSEARGDLLTRRARLSIRRAQWGLAETPQDHAAADHPLAYAKAALTGRPSVICEKSGSPWPREFRQNYYVTGPGFF
jgi:hypothetical protein